MRRDFCARGNDILSGSGNKADNATALSWYTSCLGAKDLPTLTSNCVSNSEASYLNATSLDNAQDSDLATCKSQCGYMYSTCLASGDESVKSDCLSFYSECTSGTNATTSSLNCVADVEQCYLDGKEDRICDQMNAQCRNECTRARSACGSKDSSLRFLIACTNVSLGSGDSSISAQCDSQYESCLGSSKLEPSIVDCVSRTEACYTSGKYTDAECDAQNGKTKILSHLLVGIDFYTSYLQNHVLQKRKYPPHQYVCKVTNFHFRWTPALVVQTRPPFTLPA